MTQPAEAPATVAAPAAPGPGTSGAPAPPEVSHQDRVATLHAELQRSESAPKAPAGDDLKPDADAAKDEDKARAEAKPADAPKLDKDGKPVVEKKDEATKDPKLAARFSALATEQKKTVDGRAQLDAQVRAHTQREQAFQAQMTQREQAIAARETKARERDEADHELLAKTPEKLFQHLIALGIDDDAKLDAVAKRAWGEQRAKQQATDAAKPKTLEDPKKQPLTLEQWEKLEADRAEKAQLETKLTEYNRGFEETYPEGHEKAGTPKYEAAHILFSPEERLRHGDRIGRALQASGTAYSLEDLREAVNTFAENDERWHRLQKRAPQVPSATTAKPIPATPDTKAADSPARQSSQGHKTLSNDAVTESSPPATDDKKPDASKADGLSYKEARKKRLAELSSRS